MTLYRCTVPGCGITNKRRVRHPPQCHVTAATSFLSRILPKARTAGPDESGKERNQGTCEASACLRMSIDGCNTK